MTKKGKLQGKDFAVAVAKIAVQLNCSDVVVLDLKGKSPATDYFVIATGTSDRQIRTVADETAQLAKSNANQLFGRAGYEQGKWVLLDFVDVIVHLFDDEYRKYYDLEMLWGDAVKVIID